jgi:hypothetical protein
LKPAGFSGGYPGCLETFNAVLKPNGFSGGFPGCLKIFQAIWKPGNLKSFKRSRNCQGCLETYLFWRISRMPRNFPGCLKTCQISGGYPGFLETFQPVWKPARFLEDI